MRKLARNTVMNMTTTSSFWVPPNATLIPRAWRSYEPQGVADGSGAVYQKEKRALQPVPDRQGRSTATWYHSPQYRADPWQKNRTQTGTGALIIPFDSFSFPSDKFPNWEHATTKQKGQFLYERKEKQKLRSQRKWQHSCSQLLCGSVAEDHRDHSLRSDYLPL